MAQDHFYFKRRRYEVIDRIILGRRNYLATRRLSAESRRRYLAFDPVAGPHGALRVLQLLPRGDETWQRVGVLQRLGQENPELPQILEYHRLGDDIAIVQPWIEAEDLRWWVRKMRESHRQRLGTPEAIRLCRGLAHAVHHLHRRCNVVHADIKPANIILSSTARRLTLIDYGSAWGIEHTATRKVYCTISVGTGLALRSTKFDQPRSVTIGPLDLASHRRLIGTSVAIGTTASVRRRPRMVGRMGLSE